MRSIALASFVSRILGFARITVLVYAIGGTSSSVGGQTFDVANSIPTNLYGLVAGGVLGAVLVPQIISALLEGAHGKARIDRLLTLTIGGAALVTVLATVAAPALVFVYASGWPSEWLRLATSMAYWCLPQIFFYILYAVLAQMLNSQGVFGWPAWTPAISNLVSIVGVLGFIIYLPSGVGDVQSWNPLMVAVLCGTSTLSIAIQAAMLIVPLRRTGFSFHLRIGLKGLGGVGRVASLTFLGVGVGQLSFLALSNIATRAGQSLHASGVEGPGLNSYGLAYLLVFLPHGVATVSIATATFPRLSRYAATRNLKNFGTSMAHTSELVTFLCLGTTAVLFVAAPLITEVLWGSRVIGDVLRPLSLGLLGLSQTYVLTRGLFAFHDGRGPFFAQLAAAIVSAGGSLAAGLLFPPERVVIGIAGSVAASNLIAWAVAHVALRSRMLKEESAAARFSVRPRRSLVLAASFLVSVSVGLVIFGVLGDASSVGRQVFVLSVVVLVTVISYLLCIIAMDGLNVVKPCFRQR